jgi:hypothetical protein
MFPTTPEWDGLGTYGYCQDEKAEKINKADLKSFNHGKIF